MIFNSDWKYGEIKLPDFTQDQIKNETMLFSADIDIARYFGGSITESFCKLLKEQSPKWDNAIIDSRVHMLMPGWYPCIPGWHHDDIPRTRSDGQPNYENMDYKSEHVAAIIGDASRTEFLKGDIHLPIPNMGRIIYSDWHEKVESLKHNYLVSQIEPNRLVYFDWQTFHRGMPATKNGWRMFIRASIKTDRVIKNEIRKQSQVYMSAINSGW